MDFFGFIFTSVEPQGKGLASPPDPRQTLSLRAQPRLLLPPSGASYRSALGFESPCG